jgi:hypothetical protein
MRTERSDAFLAQDFEFLAKAAEAFLAEHTQKSTANTAN